MSEHTAEKEKEKPQQSRHNSEPPPLSDSGKATPRSENPKNKELNVELKNPSHIRKLSQPLSALFKLGEKLQDNHFLRSAEITATHKRCVIKTYNKPSNSKRTKEIVAYEFKSMMTFDHPNIVKAIEAYEDTKHFYIVYEGCSGPTLGDYLKTATVTNERFAARAVTQLLSAVQYFSAKDGVHGGIRPECIRFCSKDVEQHCFMKLDGFDGEMLSPTLRASSSRRFLESPYNAPELQESLPTEKSDVWSCGVIALIILGDLMPRAVGDMERLRNRLGLAEFLFHGPKWNTVSAEAKEFIATLLQHKMENRPTVAECLNHPWVRKHAEKLKNASISRIFSKTQRRETRTMIKAAIVRFIIYRVSKSESLRQLSEQFEALDLNHDGFLSLQELEQALMRIKPEEQAREEAKQIMAGSDLNNNGMVDYTEFLISHSEGTSLLSRENLLIVFNTIDRDSSGNISMKELKTLLALPESEENDLMWRVLVKTVDSSGDGEISYSEFEKLMQKAVED